MRNDVKIHRAIRKQRAKEATMTTERVYKVAREIDDLNAQVEVLVRSIANGGHPRARQIADALHDEPVVVLASAIDVAQGIIEDRLLEAEAKIRLALDPLGALAPEA